MSEKFIADISKMFFEKYGIECLSPSSRIQLPRFHPPKNREASDWECECGEMNKGSNMYCKICKQSRYPVYYDETDDPEMGILQARDLTVTKKESREQVSITEMTRLILGLRAAGWSEEKINNFMLFIESGEEQYKPSPDNPPPAAEND